MKEGQDKGLKENCVAVAEKRWWAKDSKKLEK